MEYAKFGTNRKILNTKLDANINNNTFKEKLQ